MDAIILAGGFGTRLQKVVYDVPKPMADINGRPFLEFILDYLLKQGIKRVIISVGYKAEVIMRYFGESFQDIKIVYEQEIVPLGTGGAIKKAIEKVHGESALVINGDTIFPIDLNQLIKKHNHYLAGTTIALKYMGIIDRYGIVDFDEPSGRIIDFKEKNKHNQDSGFINGGIYVVNKQNIINHPMDTFSFEKDYLEMNVCNNKIFGYVSDSFFIDIGVPEDYYYFIEISRSYLNGQW